MEFNSCDLSETRSSPFPTEMDTVISDIFESCDKTKTGRVAVSQLIGVIKPYIEDNAMILEALSEILDPENIDPQMTSEAFCSVMSNFARDHLQDNSFHDLPISPLFHESTPRPSFASRHLGAALNISPITEAIFEDQIKELSHQNKKFEKELSVTRTQLLGQEELNELLQKDILKLAEHLNNERDINKNLLRDNTCLEELREDMSAKQTIIERLQNQVLQFEKENQHLKETIANLEPNINRKYLNDLETNEKLMAMQATVDDLLATIRGLNDNIEVIQKEKHGLAKLLQNHKVRDCISHSENFHSSCLKDPCIDDLYQQIRFLQDENNELRKSEEALQEILQENEKQTKLLNIKENELEQKDAKISKLELKLTKVQMKLIRTIKTAEENGQIIEILKEDIDSWKHKNKCLEIHINNLKAEKDDLFELHQIDIDNFAKEIKQTKCDIEELEEKFNKTFDKTSLLRTKNYKLLQDNTTLSQQYQNIAIRWENLNAEYNSLVEIINHSLDEQCQQSPQDKLQTIINNFKNAKTKNETLLEQKQKEICSLNKELQVLEVIISEMPKAEMKAKKTSASFERNQILLEKMRDKVYDLEEAVENGRIKYATQGQELNHLQVCYRKLVDEKLVISNDYEEIKLKHIAKGKAFNELANMLKELLNRNQKLHYVMYKFSQNWKIVFDQVEPIDAILKQLSSNCPEDNDEIDTKTEKAIANLEGIYLIIDALCGCNLQNLHLKIASLAKSRPVSPDSPNLELFNCRMNNSGDDENSTANVESDLTENLENMYLVENLEYLFLSVKIDELPPSLPELETFVQNYILSHIFDCNTFRNRLQCQFDDLRKLSMELKQQFQTFLKSRTNSRRNCVQFMEKIVQNLFILSQSAERFGATQEEFKLCRTTHKLVRYMAYLNHQLDQYKMRPSKCKKCTRRLSREIVDSISAR